MKYVLDASVGIKWVMNEIDSAKAGQLRDDFRSRIHDLIAPDSFPLEAAHALTKAGRRAIVTDATRLWVELMDAPHSRLYLALLQVSASGRPILNSEARNALKVSDVSRHEHSTVLQDDRGDTQIHLADVEVHPLD